MTFLLSRSASLFRFNSGTGVFFVSMNLLSPLYLNVHFLLICARQFPIAHGYASRSSLRTLLISLCNATSPAPSVTAHATGFFYPLYSSLLIHHPVTNGFGFSHLSLIFFPICQFLLFSFSIIPVWTPSVTSVWASGATEGAPHGHNKVLTCGECTSATLQPRHNTHSVKVPQQVTHLLENSGFLRIRSYQNVFTFLIRNVERYVHPLIFF